MEIGIIREIEKNKGYMENEGDSENKGNRENWEDGK